MRKPALFVQGWFFCVMRRKGSHKVKDFVGKRRESGVPSVLRSKTLAQAEFSSAEQVK